MDLWAINPNTKELPVPYARFENPPSHQYFIVNVPGKGTFLIDTQGYDHVRYALRVQTRVGESMNDQERAAFTKANEKEHPVEEQWHYPIMTKAGFEPKTKTATGFVRKYHYENAAGHHITVSTGASSDHWEDKVSGKMGYWGTLESHVNSL
jgi:hypothetical protein